MSDLLQETAKRAIRYQQEIRERSVAPSEEALANLSGFDEPFPETPS